MRQTLRFQRVPEVSLAGKPDDVAVNFGTSLKEYGFVVVTGHGIRPALLDAMDKVSKQLFELTPPTKRYFETPINGRQTGYTSFGRERAKGSDISDLKEFWHVMREGMPGLPNQFPVQVPGFKQVALEFFQAQEECALQLLGILGHYLGFERGHLEALVRGSKSVLRILHYPPLKGGEAGLRAAAHADINFLTLLLPPSEAGLEILRPNGEWMPVIHPTGGLIVNTGDMLNLYTQHMKREVIPSTQHRVTNGPPNSPFSPKSRYSYPFFVHPRGEVELGRKDGKVVTAASFLEERLRENGVKA